VPAPGAALRLGLPICTVFAAGPSPGAVRRLLAERAAAVRRDWIG